MAPKPEDSSTVFMMPTATTSSLSQNNRILFDSEDGEPTILSLTDSHEHLSNRAQILLEHVKETEPMCNCNDAADKSEHFCVVLKACETALETVFTIFEKEAWLILQDLNSNYPKLTSWHALLAQKKALYYLDLIDEAMKCCFTSPDAHDSLRNVVNSVSSQLREGNSTDILTGRDGTNILISPWVIPRLAFDVILSKPLIYDSHKPTISMFERSNSGLVAAGNAPERNGNVTISVPIEVEVRAIAELFHDMNYPKTIRAFKLEVIRCVHRGQSNSRGSVIGDVSLVLALKPIRSENEEEGSIESLESENKELVVSEARMVQVNAAPPIPCTSVDFYTSSHNDDEEITLCLQFQTRRCVNEAYPKMLVDLVVSM